MDTIIRTIRRVVGYPWLFGMLTITSALAYFTVSVVVDGLTEAAFQILILAVMVYGLLQNAHIYEERVLKKEDERTDPRKGSETSYEDN